MQSRRPAAPASGRSDESDSSEVKAIDKIQGVATIFFKNIVPVSNMGVTSLRADVFFILEGYEATH